MFLHFVSNRYQSKMKSLFSRNLANRQSVNCSRDPLSARLLKKVLVYDKFQVTFKKFIPQGFTLIEVLIATMILSGALIAISSSWTGSVMAYRKGRKINVITHLLQKQATEMELQFKGESLIADRELEGDFGRDYPDLSWKTEVKPLEFPDLAPILVNQSDGGIDQLTLTVIQQMSSQLSQAIKEMKVSIFWKQGENISTYSITTYLVSYNQLALPGAGAPQGAGNSPGVGSQ